MNSQRSKAEAARFVSTRWSLVLAAGRRSSPAAKDALDYLCAAYWYPLYAFVCRRGYSSSDAQDLTQAFFARLIEKNDLKAADPDRGRFRSFLLASMKHFLANEWDKATAQKRGGGFTTLPIDFEQAEKLYQKDSSNVLTAEELFERKWALTLIDRAFSRLESEFRRAGKSGLFGLLKGHLIESRPGTAYSEVAASAGMSEGAVKVTVHRMRRRFRELLRAEIAETVSTLDQIDAEVHYLMMVLRA